MKAPTKTFAASALIFAIAGPASAAVSDNIGQEVNQVAGSGSNVFVNVDGNTVILTGYVEGTFALQQTEQTAKQSDVTNVNNYFIRSR